MAYLSNIPLSDNKSMFDGLMEQYLGQKQLAQEAPLKRAQAAKADMLAKLISQVSGIPMGGEGGAAGAAGGGAPAGAQGGASSVNPQQKANLLAALLGIPITHQTMEGKIVTMNPLSGNTQVEQIGETPEEKRKGEAEKVGMETESKANTKRKGEIEKDIKELINQSGDAVNISRLLDKNPKLTGPFTSIANTVGLSGQEHANDIGEFTGSAGPLIGNLGKIFSPRGGIQATKMAAEMKPNINKPMAYNKGLMKTIHKGIKEKYRLLSEEYKDLTGKDIKYKLPDFYDKEEEAESSGNADPFGIR